MKYLLTILLAASTHAWAGAPQEAKHSPFTIEQIAKHLGLGGGNWEIGFDEKCYLGFVITHTSKDGSTSKEYHWSSDASKTHGFHFMHRVESRPSNDAIHSFTFSSTQFGEWKKEGAISTRTSGGSGMTYDAELPSNHGMQRLMENSFKAKMNEPALLYSWTSERTKQAFQLDVIFSTTKIEANKDGKPLDTMQPPAQPDPKT